MMSPGCGRSPSMRTEGISNRLQPQCASCYTVKVRLQRLCVTPYRPPQEGTSKRHDLALRLWHNRFTVLLLTHTFFEPALRTAHISLVSCKSVHLLPRARVSREGEQRLDQPPIGSTDM